MSEIDANLPFPRALGRSLIWQGKRRDQGPFDRDLAGNEESDPIAVRLDEVGLPRTRRAGGDKLGGYRHSGGR